jgi:hypothetical protein
VILKSKYFSRSREAFKKISNLLKRNKIIIIITCQPLFHLRLSPLLFEIFGRDEKKIIFNCKNENDHFACVLKMAFNSTRP